MAKRDYQLSWLDPEYMAAHPDCDLEHATRRLSRSTRADAIREGKRIAREIKGTVQLEVFVKTRHGWDFEGAREEITQ